MHFALCFVNCFFSALAKDQTDKIRQDKEKPTRERDRSSIVD